MATAENCPVCDRPREPKGSTPQGGCRRRDDDGEAHRVDWRKRALDAELRVIVLDDAVRGFRAGLAGDPKPRGMCDGGLDAFIRADQMRARALAAERERDDARRRLVAEMPEHYDAPLAVLVEWVVLRARTLLGQEQAAVAERSALRARVGVLEGALRDARTRLDEAWSVPMGDLLRERIHDALAEAIVRAAAPRDSEGR